jgi:thiosulfate dehydrogenase [quinone] large subunit
MGLLFLWAFLDKTFGLGFATKPAASWLNGGSPTLGFLKFGTHGPFAPYFQSIAGFPIVDFVFMLGLLGIGVAMTLGAGVKIAGWSGTVMTLLMWLALIPPTNHPFLDEHILEAICLVGLTIHDNPSAGDVLGIGKWWKSTNLVKKCPWLV